MIHSYSAKHFQPRASWAKSKMSSALVVILSVMVALPWILVTSSTHLKFLQKYVPKLYKNFTVMFTLTESLFVKLKPR